MRLKFQLDVRLAHIELAQVIFNPIAQIGRTQGGEWKSYAGFLWLACSLLQAESGHSGK
jgi:hypothetical protein